MNILFLDMDGVCNNKQHFLVTKDLLKIPLDSLNDADVFQMKRDVAPQNMWCLKYILDNVPNLKIVISSAWRNYYNLEQFKELFKIFGIDGECIIGKTPKKMSSTRADEILMYMVDSIESDTSYEWVALDDHSIFDLGTSLKKHEILTDSWMGLTLPDAFKVIQRFKPEFKAPILMI